MPQILIFGASITQGFWDREGGWTHRLRKYIDNLYLEGKLKEDWNVFNLGISGNTSVDLLKRINFETMQRSLSKIDLIIISIGLNDSQFVNTKKIIRVEPRKFEENLTTIFKIMKKYADKILFLGLTPVDESKVDPIPWASERSYKNVLINKYNRVAQRLCKKKEVFFIDIFNRWMKIDYKKLLEDGVHPNSEGHQLIFTTVKDFLLKTRII